MATSEIPQPDPGMVGGIPRLSSKIETHDGIDKNIPGLVRAIPNLHSPVHGYPTNHAGANPPSDASLPEDFVVDPAKRQVFQPWIPGAGVRPLGEERSLVRMQLMDLHRTQASLDSGVRTTHGVTSPLTERDRQNLEESIKHLTRVTGEKLDELNSSVPANYNTYRVYYNSRRPGSFRNPGPSMKK